MAQFLQDVQGYSPLRAGLAFLPMPVSVFLSSQLTSRVLLRRLPQKAVMAMGTLDRDHGPRAGHPGGCRASYLQIVASLVFIGAGAASTFVALTSASLAEVAPEIAGAASGLVNVSQQLARPSGSPSWSPCSTRWPATAQLVPGATAAASIHSLDDVFGVAAVFALGALATVVFGVRPTSEAEQRAIESVPQRWQDEEEPELSRIA